MTVVFPPGQPFIFPTGCAVFYFPLRTVESCTNVTEIVVGKATGESSYLPLCEVTGKNTEIVCYGLYQVN